MTKLIGIIFLLFLCPWHYSFAQNHKFEWLDYSNSGTQEFNNGINIRDSSIYTVGDFTGILDMDPTISIFNIASNGGSDCFIKKQDLNKNLVWAHSIGGGQNDVALDVEIAPNGDVVITGYFEDTVDFDPGIGVFELIASSRSYFILKLSGNGDFIWAIELEGSSTFISDIGLTIDSANNILATGFFIDTMDFEPTGSVQNLYTGNDANTFIAKYDSAGSFLWAKSLEGGSNGATQLRVDSFDDIFVCGSFKDTVDFNPDIFTEELISPDFPDGYLLKLGNGGDFLWVKRLEGGLHDGFRDLRFGENDTIYLTGTFNGIVDFDPGAGVNNLTSYYNGSIYNGHVFVAKWTPSGEYVWALNFGSLTQDRAGSIYLDQDDNVYVAGQFSNSVDFDPSLNDYLINSGSSNLSFFISRYNRNGEFNWVKWMRGVGDFLIHLEMDNFGALYAASSLIGNNLDYDPGYQTFNITSGGNDYFLLKLEPCVPSASTDTVVICNGSSYTWINGLTYNSNNTSAKMVLEAANGCDSIVSLNLSFSNPTSSTDVITACNSYTWIDGNTYTSNNNSAMYTLANISGCDSTVTLNLTISQNDTVVDAITSCGPYTWIDGNTYASSNSTADLVYTNVNGCDSVVQLDLIVGAPTSGTYVVSACELFNWIDGNTYTNSNNTATFTTTNSLGCDSLITLDLTILPATFGTDVITACDSYTWIDGNTYLSSNNTADYIMTNTFGCDSIVTLELTINTAIANVTSLAPQLVAAVGASSYQWLDCLNGNAVIAGATNNVFVATTNGEYAVIVEENGCLDTSVCFVINNVDLRDIENGAWKIYPNPASGYVMVKFDQLPLNTVIELTNPLGQVISKSEVRLPLVNLKLGEESGIYFVRIISESKVIEVRVIQI